MKAENIIWTCFIVLSCWILPFLHATRKKRSLPYFSKKVMHILSEEYSNMRQFESILDPFLIERVAGTDNNKIVQQYIESEMSNLGWNITKDRFMDTTPYGQKAFTNIIATFDTRAPTRVALVCHFDSKYETGYEFIGATDSAVPCAMLIDLARNLDCLLKKSKGSNVIPQTTVQLIFLDGEEAFQRWTATDSIYGARHLAHLWQLTPDPHNNTKNMLDTITDFILLDLIGTSDVSFKNMYDSTSRLYKHLYNIEQKLQTNQHLKIPANSIYKPYFNNLAARPYGVEDDHKPFLEYGVNILHLISVPFPNVWHKQSDNKSSLDFNAIDNFNRIFRVFVASYLNLEASKNSCRRK